jgi:hypothetical protein
MHTATSATALAVLQEGSARSARRPLERELSTVADAYKWFEREPAQCLALRADGALSFTPAGDARALSSSGFAAGFTAPSTTSIVNASIFVNVDTTCGQDPRRHEMATRGGRVNTQNTVELIEARHGRFLS